MEPLRKKRCLRDEKLLPSFHEVFPCASRLQATLETESRPTSTLFSGLLPLSTSYKHLDETTEDAQIASSNEILTAFDSLDTEAPTSSRVESQCGYGNKKCFKPRALKTNGSLHTLCHFHRERSVRNQRTFDHKKRRHQAIATETVNNQLLQSQERTSSHNDEGNVARISKESNFTFKQHST